MFQFRRLAVLFFLSRLGSASQAVDDHAQWLNQALQARFADLAGDYQSAMQQARQLALASRQSDAYAYAFELARAAQALPEAEAIARAWLEQHPQQEEALLALLGVLFVSQPWKESMPYAERLLQGEINPHHAVQLSRLSAELPREEKIAFFQSLTERFPQNPYLYYYLALIAKEQGKVDVALEALAAANALDASWRQLEIMQAEVLSSVGDLQAARAIIEPLRARSPHDPELLSAHIDLLAEHYQWDEAIALAEKWLKMNPEDGYVLQLLAWLQAQAGHLSAARGLYSRLLALEYIDLNTFYFHVAQAAEGQGEDEEARRLWQAVAPSSPLHVLALQQSALLALKRGDEAQASRDFEGLRRQYPEQALEFYMLELTQRKRFRLPHRALWQRAEEDFPGAPALALWAAEHESPSSQQAEQHYLSLLSLEPDHVEALHAYGNWLLSQGRDEEGAQLIRQAVQEYGHAPEIQDSYARILQREGQAQEALNWQRRAYATYRSGEIVAHYVELLAANGQEALAERIFQNEWAHQPEDAHLQALSKRFARPPAKP